MRHLWILIMLMMGLLSSCSKPPDVEAPCHEFGKYCPQYPINDEPIRENV